MLSTKLPDAATVKLPKRVQIEPAGQCNLRCEMCTIRFRREGPPFGPPALMRMGLFRDIIDQFWAAEELHLQGLGEPFLHPGFFEMASYAAQRGMRVTTNSNMTLFDPARAEECVRSKLSWIRVSIDGATAATYESIRAGSRLGRVLRNIASLREAKERMRSATPRLFLVMVLMKRNIHELKDVVRLAYEHGMEQVFAQHLCYDLSHSALPGQYQSMREFVEAESLLGVSRSGIQPHFNEALLLAGQLKIELRLPHIGVRKHPLQDSGKKRCDWPWRSAYITYDGKAMPCCMIALPERMNLGDVARDGVLTTWNNEAYREFRTQLASGAPPAVCRTCSVYRGTF